MSAEETDPRNGHRRRHMIVRRHQEASILMALLESGPLSRTRIADVAGVSKPTTNAIVEDLRSRGILDEQTDGPPPIFAIGPGAGVVGAVAVGATHLRAAACDAHGSILHSIGPVPTAANDTALLDGVSDLIATLASNVSPFALRHLTLSIPGVPRDGEPSISLAPHVPAITKPGFLESLSRRTGLSISVENDANMAALGERWQGAAQGRQDFVTLHVGTGLGLGVVAAGQLLRGARGAAGEIGYLPLGGKPGGSLPALESRLGRAGIRSLLREHHLDFDHVPLDEVVIALESAAAQGTIEAEEALDRIARTLAGALLSVQAILDPSLIILNGAIGASDSLARRVRALLADLSPLHSSIVTTTLGSLAPLLGALSLGRERLVQELTSSEVTPDVRSV